jgi:hypothetical protein
LIFKEAAMLDRLLLAILFAVSLANAAHSRGDAVRGLDKGKLRPVAAAIRV